VDAARTFNCPRCDQSVTEPFYGPCASCRADLRRLMWREAEAVEAPRYEPAMHVVPNQIASKE
jgi:hypothetical protein